MLNVRLVAVGGIKESFFSCAIAEYTKRLTKYCKFEIIEIRESTPAKETRDIMDKVKGHAFLFDIAGDLITSPTLADKISHLTQTTSAVTFIIGGSNGVTCDLNAERISFGRVTYPHQLFRVIATEQIYRAFTIIAGEKYHK